YDRSLGGPWKETARTRWTLSGVSLGPVFFLFGLVGEQQLGRLVEALEPHFADAVEREVRPRRLHDRTRHDDLAPRGARDHSRRQVDVAPVIVTVAIQRLPGMDPDSRQR